MKLKELCNLKKEILKKQQIIEKKEERIKELDEKIEKLELITKVKQEQQRNDSIDISNLYALKTQEKVYFVKETLHGIDYYYNDLFTKKELERSNCLRLSYLLPEYIEYVKKINEVYPELNAYFEEKVPLDVLIELYYQINNIDPKEVNKTIKKVGR